MPRNVRMDAAASLALEHLRAQRIDAKDVIQQFRRSLFKQAVAIEGGNYSAAARLLGVHRNRVMEWTR